MMTSSPSSSSLPAQNPQVWLASHTWHPVDKSAFKALTAQEQLLRIRHSTAHVLAAALLQVQPTAQLATGPATATGFFYDVKTETPLAEADLETLTAQMKMLVGRAAPFEHTEVPKAEALAYFEAQNQPHKVEVMNRLPVETVTLYRCGTFVDLCAGPHVPHTGLCGAFKLTALAASHWKDETLPSLTRITGTAWANPKDLARYLEFVEDSKARDHRVLGPALDLFSFHPWGAGAFWHPKGMKLRRALEGYWRDTLERYGYVEIGNPILYKKELFETSGHWEHFQENMFVFKNEAGEPEYAIKPMNCPDTMLFFRSRLRSYKELPLRIAEGQILHRNEATGAMHGLMRTRMFVQDDAHLFVSEEQVTSEVQHLFAMLHEVYSLFDLDYTFSLSTRPANFMGEVATWDQAEAALKLALASTGKAYAIEEGEGAFYGPKIDVQIRDSLGRRWQCGTFQLDFQLPERFELGYIAADGSTQRPIVIHRAIFGSFERFMGILTEHLGGAFPTWLAPVQAVVLPIAERHLPYAQQVQEHLAAAGFRVELNAEESINYRVRQSETQKIPFMLVVGDQEAEAQSVAMRRYGGGERNTLPLAEFTALLQQEVGSKALTTPPKTYDDLFFRPEASLGDALATTEAAGY
jgi:threonyl-tRNA synthetase